MTFRDVLPGHWAFEYIEWVYCQGIASGYSCGVGCLEFRPDASTTRGQIVKMVVLAAGFPLILPPGAPHFADVGPTDPFYLYAEVAVAHGLVQGYGCGGPGEPCDPQQRPYYRPANYVTRAQLAKVIVLAAGLTLIAPPTPPFVDVPADNWAYRYTATAAEHGIVTGYNCGGPGEPCPGIYFRPVNEATRAQLSKMLFQAFGP
jgi:hypothetical protein